MRRIILFCLQIGSRRVIQYAGILMLIQGVISKFGAVFIIIPEPVVGGMFCVMFGMICAFGKCSDTVFLQVLSFRSNFFFFFLWKQILSLVFVYLLAVIIGIDYVVLILKIQEVAKQIDIILLYHMNMWGRFIAAVGIIFTKHISVLQYYLMLDVQ